VGEGAEVVASADVVVTADVVVVATDGDVVVVARSTVLDWAPDPIDSLSLQLTINPEKATTDNANCLLQPIMICSSRLLRCRPPSVLHPRTFPK